MTNCLFCALAPITPKEGEDIRTTMGGIQFMNTRHLRSGCKPFRAKMVKIEMVLLYMEKHGVPDEDSEEMLTCLETLATIHPH